MPKIRNLRIRYSGRDGLLSHLHLESFHMNKETRVLSADTMNEFFAAFEKDWKKHLEKGR